MINSNTIKEWLIKQDSYDFHPKPATIKVMHDPQVAGTFAVQFTDKNDDLGVVQLLFVTEQHSEDSVTADQILDETLEEVEFESWPPKSGSLQFFH